MTSRSRSGSESTATCTSNASISAIAMASGSGPWSGTSGAGGVDGRVAGDREEPGRGRATLAPVAARRPPHRRERLLRGVVGRGVVAQHPLDERVDRAAVALVEDLEGLSVARDGDLFEQLFVRKPPRIHAPEAT